jgi:hypothetical protein
MWAVAPKGNKGKFIIAGPLSGGRTELVLFFTLKTDTVRFSETLVFFFPYYTALNPRR